MSALAQIRRVSRIIRFALFILTPNLFLSAPAAPASKGQWTPHQTWSGTAVHLALLPSDGSPYHSRVIWWQTSAVDPMIGGVWGWKTGQQSCAAYPDSNFVPLGLGHPGVNIFCSGHSQLGDGSGRLFVAGGTESGSSNGIQQARLFTPGTGQASGTWDTSASLMSERRWYPSSTQLRDPSRVLVTSGSKYGHIWFYGGERNGLPLSSPRDDSLHRFGGVAGGVWDPTIYPRPRPGGGGTTPDARQGHTTVNPGTHTYFGGRDSSGNPRDEVWFLYRDANVLGSEYDYNWQKIVPGVSPSQPDQPPKKRSEHSAAVVFLNTMVVFGGRGKTEGQPPVDTTLNDAWRLYQDPQLRWRWSEMAITNPDSAPTARFGHSAVLDTSYKIGSAEWKHRMAVFGGIGAIGSTPADTEIYLLTFDRNAPNNATWSKATVRYTALKPAPRYDHAMEMNLLTRFTGPSGPGRYAVMFGGRLGATACSDTVWKLWFYEDSTLEWQHIPVQGPGPSARAGHSGTFDPSTQLFFVFGGRTAAGVADSAVWVVDLKQANPVWVKWKEHAFATLSGHTGALGYTVFSRIPEIFTAGATGGSWEVQWNAPLLQRWYPLNFVVPGSTTAGGRVFTAGPDPLTYWLDIPAPGSPAGPWRQLPNGNSQFVPSSGVMYQPGRVMVAGGYDFGGTVTGRTKTINAADTMSRWVAAANTMQPRQNHNLVLLPTGEVLAVGGMRNPGNANTDPIYRPEIWNPAAYDSGAWYGWSGVDSLAANALMRGYHSSAILLPDARVLCAGGDGTVTAQSDSSQLKANLFCPPYLFNSGGDLAARPVIDNAPATLTWGKPFTLCTPNTATISRVCLIRAGAATHGFDENQRYVLLTHSVASNPARLLVNPPASADSAPPGDYLLFVTGSADGPNVPSIARWVRLGSTPGNDTCDTVAPAAVADLSGCYYIYGPNAGKIDLAWTAPADDGTLAASGRGRVYDIRYSYQPINTETQFNNAVSVSPAPPAPATVGTLERHIVGDFPPNTTVYFRMKTIDDRGAYVNASAMSNQAAVNTCTLCLCDDGGGFYGGSGGGGGGGLRARRAAEEASAQSEAVESGTFVENSLLNGARIGERTTDLYRLAVPPRIESGAYAVRIRSAGDRAAALDAARLLVVDHAPDVRAFATGSGVALGNRVAAARATAGDGTDLSSALDGSGEFAFAIGETLTVELGADAGSPAGGSGALVLEARGLGTGASTDTLGIVIQAANGSGGWQALRRLHTRRSFDELAVEAGSTDTLRLLFERSCSVRFVGRLVRATEPPQLQWADLLSARSSRSGNVGGALAAADTTNSTLLGPDTLALGFSVPPQAEGTVRDYFLVVDATPLAHTAALPAAPTAATRVLPARFALHQNQPNPFSAQTTIRFDLPVGAMVRLDVFDLQGRRLRVLADRYYVPGYHSVEWDRSTHAGSSVGPGIYFYRIQAGPFRERRKMVLLP